MGSFSKITIFCHNIRQGKVIKYYCTRFLICLKKKRAITIIREATCHFIMNKA